MDQRQIDTRRDGLGWASEAGREPAYQRWLTEIEYPETKPTFDVLVADREGNLWVRRTSTSYEAWRPWTVFSADGALLGEVSLPSNLCEPRCRDVSASLIEIGTDYVLSVVRDEPDVEHIVPYRLQRT